MDAPLLPAVHRACEGQSDDLYLGVEVVLSLTGKRLHGHPTASLSDFGERVHSALHLRKHPDKPVPDGAVNLAER